MAANAHAGRCCDGASAKAIEGATVQIELALNDSRAPVEFLGEAIRRMASALQVIESKLSKPPTAGSLELPHAELKALRRDLYASIEKLQFHDRLVQHLSHVRDHLAAIANQIAASGSFDGAGNAAADAWDDLNARLRQRLISDAQRELFDLVLSSEHAPERSDAKRNDYAAQGSIDLF